MLSDLRRKELLDAQNIIVAQESLINFSSSELSNTHQILKASENVAELSRSEAIDLHDQLKRAKELNISLSEEIDRLLKEIDTMKKNTNEG